MVYAMTWTKGQIAGTPNIVFTKAFSKQKHQNYLSKKGSGYFSSGKCVVRIK